MVVVVAALAALAALPALTASAAVPLDLGRAEVDALLASCSAHGVLVVVGDEVTLGGEIIAAVIGVVAHLVDVRAGRLRPDVGVVVVRAGEDAEQQTQGQEA